MKDTKNIAVLVQDITVDYASEALKGIADFYKNKNVNLIIAQTRLPNLEYGNYEYQYFASTRIIDNDDIDAIIVITAGYCTFTSPEKLADLLCHLNTKKMISMAVRLPLSNVSYTVADCSKAYEDIVRHLIQKHDCKRIAFMSANLTKSVEAVERFDAFIKALHNNDMKLQPDLIFDAYFTYSSAMEVLKKRIPTKEDVNFDAIIAANDNMAFACITYLTNLGLQVPGDVKVFGYDDVPQAKIMAPTLSTINQQTYEQGYKTAELALDSLMKKDVPERVNVQVRPCYRQSCGCIKFSEEDLMLDSISEEGIVSKKLTPSANISEHMQNHKRMMDIYYLLDIIQSANSLNVLFNKFQSIIQLSDINAIAICLYDSPIPLRDGEILKLPRRVNLCVAIDKDTGISELNSDRTFNPHRQLLPEDTFSKVQGEYMLQPIFYGDVQYGYIVCRLGKLSYSMFSIYMKVFSNAIAQAYEFTAKIEENNKLLKENQLLMIKNSSLNRFERNDNLTNMLNKKGFMELGQQAIDFALEMGSTGCVFFGDIDNLKKINDNFGHEMGDLAIVTQGEILRRSFRANDIIGRLSGDEFGAIISGLCMDQFDFICKKIAKNSELICRERNLPFTLSISLGAVEFNTYSKNIKELISQADERQYIQKRNFHKDDKWR